MRVASCYPKARKLRDCRAFLGWGMCCGAIFHARTRLSLSLREGFRRVSEENVRYPSTASATPKMTIGSGLFGVTSGFSGGGGGGGPKP